MQNREELINGLAKLRGFGSSIYAVGKAAPSHRPHHHAGYRDGQPEKG